MSRATINSVTREGSLPSHPVDGREGDAAPRADADPPEAPHIDPVAGGPRVPGGHGAGLKPIDEDIRFLHTEDVETATVSYPHLEPHPDGIRLKRLPRIRVSMIVADYLGHGWSADQIAEQHPHLRPGEIHSAMAYYFDHPEEIHRTFEEEVGRSSPTEPSTLRLKLQRAKGVAER